MRLLETFKGFLAKTQQPRVFLSDSGGENCPWKSTQLLKEQTSGPCSLECREPHHHRCPVEGPQPSKIAVLIFYLSIIFTVLGTIIIIHSAMFSKESQKPLTFGIGSCLFTSGIFFVILYNILTKREQDRLLTYLEWKVEELSAVNRAKMSGEDSHHFVDNEQRAVLNNPNFMDRQEAYLEKMKQGAKRKQEQMMVV